MSSLKPPASNPFSTAPDVRCFYRGPIQEEALARLAFMVDRRLRLGVVVGAGGCGKSLLLNVFADELRRVGQVVVRESLLGVDAGMFLGFLVAHLGGWSARAASTAECWQTIAERLAVAALAGRPAVILLDDAGEAASEVLVQVARLAQTEPASIAPTVVLAVEPHDLTRLSRRLLELVELRVELDTWELSDTQQYLSEALARAQRPAELFSPAAVRRLHELTGGVPRRINQMADLALLAVEAEHLPTIDLGLVEAVFDELSIVVAPE